jgi:hypothetical protein
MGSVTGSETTLGRGMGVDGRQEGEGKRGVATGVWPEPGGSSGFMLLARGGRNTLVAWDGRRPRPKKANGSVVKITGKRDGC